MKHMDTTQVAERLNLTTFQVKRLAREGAFGTMISITNGTGRKKYIYPTSGVREYEKSLKPTKKIKVVEKNTLVAKVNSPRVDSPTTKLDRIEEKLDYLIKMWS